VYSPDEEIDPHAVPVQPAPLTLQTVAVLVVPDTCARNCNWSVTVTFALVGSTVTTTGMTTVTVAEALV